jgi:hypothetical protein
VPKKEKRVRRREENDHQPFREMNTFALDSQRIKMKEKKIIEEKEKSDVFNLKAEKKRRRVSLRSSSM